MDPAVIVEMTGVVIAVGGIVFAAGKFSENVNTNTKATEKLTEIIDNHLKWSNEIVQDHTEKFHNLDTRVTVLEKKEKPK